MVEWVLIKMNEKETMGNVGSGAQAGELVKVTALGDGLPPAVQAAIGHGAISGRPSLTKRMVFEKRKVISYSRRKMNRM